MLTLYIYICIREAPNTSHAPAGTPAERQVVLPMRRMVTSAVLAFQMHVGRHTGRVANSWRTRIRRSCHILNAPQDIHIYIYIYIYIADRCLFLFVLGETQQTTREDSVNDRENQNQSFAPAYRGQRANHFSIQPPARAPSKCSRVDDVVECHLLSYSQALG